MASTKATGFTIRQVIELTGVSEFILRTWELRYRAFEPKRTGTGRRIYSRADILKIKTLKELTLQGEKIGKIADLPMHKLSQLVEKRDFKIQKNEAHKVSDKYFDEIKEILFLADRYEWDKAHNLIGRHRESLKPREYIFNFLLKLIQEINHQVDQSRLSVAQEHILSAFVKESLFHLRKQSGERSSKSRLIVATPEGDYHEIGILMASVLTSLRNLSCLYLGPNVPKSDLCETSLRYKATHLVIASTSSEGPHEDFFKYIHFLDRHLAPTVELWIAGKNAELSHISLQRPSKIIKSMEDFESEIKKLK